MLEALAAVVVVQNSHLRDTTCRPVCFHGTIVEISWYDFYDRLVLEWSREIGFASHLSYVDEHELDVRWAKLLEDLR